MLIHPFLIFNLTQQLLLDVLLHFLPLHIQFDGTEELLVKEPPTVEAVMGAVGQIYSFRHSAVAASCAAHCWWGIGVKPIAGGSSGTTEGMAE